MKLIKLKALSEYSDNRDYTARVGKIKLRNHCSSTNRNSAVESLRLKINPIVAEESEIEK